MVTADPAILQASERHLPLSIARLGGRLKELPFLFAVLAFVVGTFLVLAQPPGQGLDEATHFNRVWTLSQGNIVVPDRNGEPGGEIPQCVTAYLREFSAKASSGSSYSFATYWRTPSCSTSPVFTGVGTAAANSPLSYAPSLLAVWFLRTAGAPLPLIFFGGRFASLLGFIILFYLAMRLTPIGRPVFFVLGLLPITLLLASSYSADPMAISLAALSVALALRCRLSAQATLGTACLLAGSLVGLCLTKPTLFVFAPLVFLVPNELLDRVVRPAAIKVVAGAIILVCAAIWYEVVRFRHGLVAPLYGVNSNTQTKYITHDPLGYLAVLARTFFVGTGENKWLPGLFFSTGYVRMDNPYAPVGLVVVGTVTMFYVYQLQVGAKRLLDGGARLVAWLPAVLAVLGVLLVETTLYIYGTPVKLPYTDAQGRYFIPLLFLLLASIALLRWPRVGARSFRWVLLGVVTMLVWLVIKILIHDYSL